jgi:hypothetical protein
MAAFKLLALAYKARRGWKRIPPEQRRKMVQNARKQVGRRGPVVAKRMGRALRNARRPR